MNRFTVVAITLATALLPCANVRAQEVGGEGKSSPPTFFERLNQQKTTFDEFRFMTSPEVRENPQWRGIATQMLATHYSFLGRPLDALRTFPFRKGDAPRDDLPSPSTHRAVPAVEWIAAQAGDYRVVMLNEAHHVPQTRTLTLSLLPVLRAKGYTHLALEALANDGKDPLPRGYPDRDSGIYTREPVFAELIREAKRLGYQLVPYEAATAPGKRQQDRETGQANAIAKVLADDPQARMLVHAGYAHIGEAQQGLPDNAKPMAMELARISGLPLLTVEQTSTRSFEAEDVDTIGRRLSAQFATSVPSVLLAREGSDAWSNKPGLYDVSVLLPSPPSTPLRPTWLALEGRRHAIVIDMTPCIGHLPCLAEARHAEEGDDAIPADQFLVLAADEVAQPLYLAPGSYRLRLLGGDGKALSQHVLSVPATTSDSPSR